MGRALMLLVVAVVAAVVGFFAVMIAAPNVIMARAIKTISRDGTMMNRWLHAPRTTEASRRVVRPSPDLAYSSCSYDLSKGPVRITMQPWTDYASLSLYAANTDNFWVRNDREAQGKPVDIVLVARGQTAPAIPGADTVTSPSIKGIALVRRLAPTAAAFAAADASRKQDVCAPL